ncbi:MAG TPA: RNA polymerase-binding protein RbpA, partial [Nocardioidaceae bacterium]|nr:RNA polymerase-binding protein RbpA [Nocardioidaceae bacterium]
MGSGSAIRGTRIGSGPMGEDERGEPAPRTYVDYYCANGHQTPVSFSVGASVPDRWDCPRCGLPAGSDSENPPPPVRIEPYKTHLAYVKERRSDDEAEAILDEALS